MKNSSLHVYIMYAEMRGIYDKMNVKIGVSDNPKKRMKGVQTGCPGEVHLIRTFEAGTDAYVHEGYFHKLYEDFCTGGEWFEFTNEHFVEKVLPEMVEYFSKIVIKGGHKEHTDLSLNELLKDVDCAQFEIDRNIDNYTNNKLIQIKLRKALTMVDDVEKVKYQKIIDNIQYVIDEECKKKRKEDQEKLAIRRMKVEARQAQKRLETIAMGVLMGMAI